MAACDAQAMVAFYYRSKHSDGACRRGPVMLEETPASSVQAFGAPKLDSEVPPEVPHANRWLQVCVPPCFSSPHAAACMLTR